MCHRAKFRADWSNIFGDMTGFRFFKMAAVRHIGFVIDALNHTRRVLGGLNYCENLVGIDAVVSTMWTF